MLPFKKNPGSFVRGRMPFFGERIFETVVQTRVCVRVKWKYRHAAEYVSAVRQLAKVWVSRHVCIKLAIARNKRRDGRKAGLVSLGMSLFSTDGKRSGCTEVTGRLFWTETR